MKFLFVDESQRQEGKNQKHLFVLCGVLVDEQNLITLETELRDLKLKYCLFNFKDLKSLADKGKKLECTQEICDALIKNNVKILSAGLGTVALIDAENVEDGYFDAIIFLIERFFLHLKREDKNGLIIHDSIEKETGKKLRRKCYRHLTEKELWMFGKSKGFFREKMYPSIFFSNDENSEILQIADLISTSISGAIWNGLKKEKFIDIENLCKYNNFLRIYWPLFARSSRGIVNGWGIKIWW